MDNFRLILFFIIFFSTALAMFFRKIPALLALPLMAFLIPLAGGVALDDTIQYVIGLGSVKLHNAYTVALFGSMLSVLLQKTGVAENFIKRGAELAGDNPMVIALIMLSLITLLFTTLGGLGAIIMVATIVLPIMSSVGLGPMTVVGIFLIGLSMGGILNAGNWAVYIDVMGLSIDEIRPFALAMFAVTFVMAFVYIAIQLYRDGHELNIKKLVTLFTGFVFIVTAIAFIYQLIPDATLNQVADWFFGGLKIVTGLLLSILFLLALIHSLKRKTKSTFIYWPAYFTPIIPLLLILVFSMNFIAAFICGLFYGFLATYHKGSLNTLIRSILDGGAVVMPAVALMLGIGMLLNAIMGPSADWNGGWPVLNLLQPLLVQVIPVNAISFIVLFSFLAPLALYRGPLNVWGMGYGLAAVFLASGMMPGAVMGLLLSVGQVQGISDPTNTHNVWLANEMQQDVQKVLWNTLPFSWSAAIVGLTIAAFMFY